MIGNLKKFSMAPIMGLPIHTFKNISAEEAIHQYRDLFNAYVLSNGNRGKMDSEVDVIYLILIDRVKEGELWYEKMEVTGEIMISHTKIYFERTSADNWTKSQGGMTNFKGSLDE